MLPLLRLLLRFRPALWLLGLVLLAMALSSTWERSTSYDDGGLGSASFAILFTIGQPFLISLHLAGADATTRRLVGVRRLADRARRRPRLLPVARPLNPPMAEATLGHS